MRLFWLFLGLAALVLIPFIIWGGAMDTYFTESGTVAWFTSYGDWAGVVGLVLLIADLHLPIPSTFVMSALGDLYGPLWGGLAAVAGSFLRVASDMYFADGSAFRSHAGSSASEILGVASGSLSRRADGLWCSRGGCRSFGK